jgi:FAD/FMN-containing dehydrogenase
MTGWHDCTSASLYCKIQGKEGSAGGSLGYIFGMVMMYVTAPRGISSQLLAGFNQFTEEWPEEVSHVTIPWCGVVHAGCDFLDWGVSL